MLCMNRHSVILLAVSALALYAGSNAYAAATSNAIFTMRFSDPVTQSAPGELVTYSVKVTNTDPEHRLLYPQVSVTAKDLEIPAVSDHGRRGKLANGKLGGLIEWNAVGDEFEIALLDGKSHTFTFQVKTPGTVGSTYCVEAETFGLPLLVLEDCNTVVKRTTATTQSTSKASLASISDLNALFRSVYGRNPTGSEWNYWATRLLDKPDRVALKGAMGYHKARGIRH